MHKRIMNVGSWQQEAKQFIKDMLPDRKITDSGSLLRIEYPEKEMYVKVNIDDELSASAYFTNSPHKREEAQDYMIYSHQHIDMNVNELDDVETAKARAKVEEANGKAYNIIKETKLYYKEFADEYYRDEISKSITKIRKFKKVPRRITGKFPVRVTFSLYVPKNENVLCLDCYYNSGLFSFVLTTDEYPKTSTHYTFGFFEQEDKLIKGGFAILAQKAKFHGSGYGLDEYDDVTPLYTKLGVGNVRVKEYDKAIEDAEKLTNLIKMYELAKASEPIQDDSEFQNALNSIMEDFKKSITQKTKDYIEKAKKQKMDEAYHTQPDIYAPPPKPLNEQLEDAIKEDVEKMKKQIKDLYDKMKDKKHPSDELLKEIHKLWHGDFTHDIVNLEIAPDSDDIDGVSINTDVMVPKSFGDENNNFLIGAIKVIVDDSDKKTTKMLDMATKKMVDVHGTSTWFVTNFYDHLPRYDASKRKTGTLVHTKFGGNISSPMNCDFSAEPLFTSITKHTTEDGVGVFWNPDLESYQFTQEVPNYNENKFITQTISKSAGKCNADINTANTSTELLPTIFYVRRNPVGLENEGKDDPKDDSFGTFSKIGMTNDINFCSMFNMSSLVVLTPRETVNGYHGCFSLGKRKNPWTLNQKWCSEKQFTGTHEIDSPMKTDDGYGYLNNYGLAYYIGEEIM